MLAAITVGPHRPLVSWINEMCVGIGDLCVYKTLVSYPQPNELVQLLSVFTPELVFLDMSSPETALTLVKEGRACYPRTGFIGFVHRTDSELLREAAAAGMAELLTAPCPAVEFEQAVVRTLESQRAGVADNVVAFLPAKAGSGSTTVMLHVAASLAQDWNQSVVVLEADLHSGVLSSLLGLDPSSSVLAALENARWMNEGAWDRFPSRALGFDLLPMPVAPEQATFSRWDYQRLLTFLRSKYDTVIADLPDVADDATVGIISQSKSIYLICTPEKPSLFLARRRIEGLKARGAQEARIHVVLNRNWDQQADFQEMEQALDRRISFVLPNDWSCLRRKTPESPLVDGESELGRALSSFVRVVAGVAPALPPAPAVQKGGLRSLFRNLTLAQHSGRGPEA